MLEKHPEGDGGVGLETERNQVLQPRPRPRGHVHSGIVGIEC